MRLRITSDGTSGGTTVDIIESEEDITAHVKTLKWVLEGGRNPQVEVTLVRIDAEVRLETDV